MSIFKKKAKPQLTVDPKALARVKTIADQDLLTWFETALGSLGVQYDGWRNERTPSEEVTVSLVALHAMWSEIEKRKHHIE